MAYDVEKLAKLAHLKALAEQVKAEDEKLDAKIGAVDTKVDTVSSKVDSLVATGGEPNVLTAVKVDGAALEITDKAVDIGASISAAVANADHLKRKIVDSVEAINLTAADAAQYIYMILKTEEAEGDKYDEYMVLDGAVEKVGDWAVDLTGYVAKEEGKGLSANDYTNEEKTKLAGLNFATDAEVTEMLAEVFGTTEPAA